MNIDKLIEDTANEILKERNLDRKNSRYSAQGKKKTRGRKNRGLTQEHYQEFKEERKAFRAVKQSDSFNPEIVETVQGEIIQDDDIETFATLYRDTCYSILNKFMSDNADLVKKHPYYWYKRILLEIKKNTPKITADDLGRCEAVWDILKDFLDYIGLFITYESFEKVTSIYKYQLQNRQELSPKYAEFCKKINNDCDSSLVNEIANNPYNQTNKIFLAKVHGIIEKTEPKQIEVHHDIRNYDNISKYRLTENNENF